MLFFDFQKDKQLKRQIHILHIFSRAEHTVTISELAETLNVSRVTVVNDIEAINNNEKTNVFLKIKFREGVELKIKGDTALASEMVNLAQDSLSFKIIQNISNGKILKIDEASLEMFVSEGTLLGVIRHMNKVLKQYRIRISTSTIDLFGKEEDIRYFLFVFFKEFNDYFGSILKNTNIVSYYTDLIKKHESDRNDLLHLSYFSSSIWLFVAKKRLEQKRFVAFDPKHPLWELVEDPEFLKFKETYAFFATDILKNENVPLAEYMWGYICCLYCVVYNDETMNHEKYSYIFSREERKEVERSVRTYVHEAMVTIGFEVHTPELIYLISFLKNIRLLSLVTPLYQKISRKVREYAEAVYPDIFHRWVDYLNEHPLPFMELLYVEDLATTLTLFTYSLRLKKKKDSLILFAFQGEPGLVNHLVKVSNLLLTEGVRAEYCISQALTNEMIKNLDADLLICNYDYPERAELAIKILRISYIPTEAEWKKVNDCILEKAYSYANEK